MDPKKYLLFINGRSYDTRGLDLACNPHNGNILGKVMLIAESILHEMDEEDFEDTVKVGVEEVC